MEGSEQIHWDPARYHTSSSAQAKWAGELVSRISFRGDERLLDIGCGDGKITAGIAEHLPGGLVIGLDASPEMIRFSRSAFCQGTYPHLEFVIGDAGNIPFRSSFHLVFSNAALHWIKDQKRVLSEIAHVLLPGGRVFLQLGGKGNGAEMFRIADDLIQCEPWNTYFEGFIQPYYFHDTPEYQEWLIAAGLEPVRVELLQKVMEQNGREGLCDWIRTTWMPYTMRIPQDRQEEFIHHLADAYILKNPPGADGIIRVRMVRLEAEAVRPGSGFSR